MSEVECPYCEHEQEVQQDDGHGCVDGQWYEEECEKCNKKFVMIPSISFDFYSHKADCMNGGDHDWEINEHSRYKYQIRRYCTACDKSEWLSIDDEWVKQKRRTENG